MSAVVVVESPAKAKTINKYLGSDFTVLASYGHVRDLPPKDGSVRPDDDFSMDWEVESRSQKHVTDIAKALKGADRLYLATDPDREGEAIAWHVLEVLAQKKALKNIDVERVVFHEITKKAVSEAMENPRSINQELVDAYLARRALDYLVGFTLSPVLWRKLPGARSAGRVQSVALRLVCERETEIEKFVAEEYWTVSAEFQTADKTPFTANLNKLDGEKLDKFALPNESAAKQAVEKIMAGGYSVGSVERKQVSRKPSPPFTTSTLQQEAARKLHFSTKRTMQIAQRLYEGIDLGGETVGLITYMRTDSVTLAAEAVEGVRTLIDRDFGRDYLPTNPREFKTKAKNAQEAHEAIRPTSADRTPAQMAKHLDADQQRLYELIWKRTVASQMENARLEQVGVDITSTGGAATFRATGSVVVFDGFYKLYQEGRDDADDKDSEKRLPNLLEKMPLHLGEVNPEQHFTQPPPRFSEASLVKKMEELGIGRPSTYASILSVLQDRNYVRLDKRRFIAEDRGRLVTTFLSNFFSRYVQYNFTADLEDQLDGISNGEIDWKKVLTDFWNAFSQSVNGTKDLSVSDVINTLDEELGPHFFPERSDGKDPRLCPECGEGRLSLKLGKFGAFAGCSNYPDCRFTRPLTGEGANGNGGNGETGLDKPKTLGVEPESGKQVSIRRGPYGIYVQLGEEEEVEVEVRGKKKMKKIKPKRTSLAPGTDPESITLKQAIGLLTLPREVGKHPESGEPIKAGIGRFGPYIEMQGMFLSLKEGDDPVSIGLNRAVTLFADSGKPPPELIGKHPKDKKPVTLRIGRWGPFVQHGRVKATLPKKMNKEDITLEEAVKLLETKGKGGAKKKAPAKKKASKKASG